MKRRKNFLMIGILILSFSFTGCSVKTFGNHIEQNSLVFGVSYEYNKINPILGNTNVDHLVFRGLMRFGDQNIPREDIAEYYTVSKDGLTYTFKIKDGIRFHNNDILQPEDVAFTINSILDESVVSTLKAEFSQVEKAEVVSENEVAIKLKTVFPPILDKLTVGIVPRGEFRGGDINNSKFNHSPIGCGPYRVVNWQKGKGIILKKFEDYYASRANIENVVFKYIPDSNVRVLQLLTGEVDITLIEPNYIENFKNNNKIDLYTIPTADYRCMMYNFNNEIFQDLSVRKALNYAIDRQAVVDGILKGYGFPAYSPLQIHKYNNNEVEKYNYNIKKAEELLDKAGFLLGNDGIRRKGGKRLEFTITAPIADKTRVNIANYLASQFRNIGADIDVQALEWNVIDDGINKFDAFILGWGSPFDADEHTFNLLHSSQIESGLNYGAYRDARVDELLQMGRTTTNEEKRNEIYKEFQEKLSENPPYNFIVYLEAVFGVNKKISGIKTRTLGHKGAGFVWNLEEWTIDG